MVYAQYYKLLCYRSQKELFIDGEFANISSLDRSKFLLRMQGIVGAGESKVEVLDSLAQCVVSPADRVISHRFKGHESSLLDRLLVILVVRGSST